MGELGLLLGATYQIEYRGLLLGEDTPYDIVAIEGLEDLPGVRSSDQSRPGGHGAIPGRDLLEPRSLVITLEVWPEEGQALTEVLAPLKAATAVSDDDHPLVIRLSGNDVVVWCRPRRRSIPQDERWARGVPTAVIGFLAADPLVYSAIESVATLLPWSSGSGAVGISWPTSWPRAWPAADLLVGTLLVNDGTATTDVVIRIAGPCEGPAILHAGLGHQLSFPYLTLGNEILVLDSRARSAVIDDDPAADRYDALDFAASTWFGLVPNANELRFVPAAAGPGCQAVVIWRSAVQ